MDITRRDFLLAAGATAAAGLVLPSWHRAVLDWIERTGRPLLEPVPDATTVLYAVDTTGYGYQLHLGPPTWELDCPTWREYLEFYRDRYPGYLEDLGLDLDRPVTREWLQRYLVATERARPDDDEVRNADLDSLVDEGAFESYREDWGSRNASWVGAFEYLFYRSWPEDAQGLRVVGGLLFEQDGGVYGDYCGVHAMDDVSLSLLPHVLARCGERVEVRIA